MPAEARQLAIDFNPAETAEREALCKRYPQEKIDAAYRKLRWLNAWRDLCNASRFTEAECAGRIIDQARQAEGEEFKITLRTLQRWRELFDRAGVEGLIDRRDGAWGPHDGRSQEAIEHFHSLYRSEHKLSVKTCHKSTLRKAQANGWRWPASYSATTKWLTAADDLAETCARREGRTAYSKN